MPAGPDFRLRKPVKRHRSQFYWLTRDGSLVFARLCPPGLILRTQTFRAAGVFRILPTHTFRVAVTVAFYLLSTQTFSGCRYRRSCILGTQTFRVAGVLHFTYTHVRGDSYANLRKLMSTLKNFCAARGLFLTQSIRKIFMY